MEENERVVAQVIGSEARDALRGLKKPSVARTSSSSSSKTKRKRVRQKPHALGATVAHCNFNKSNLHNTWNSRKHNFESTVANRRAQDDVSTGKIPRNLRMCDTSCHQRTTVSEFSSKRNDAGWKTEVISLIKEAAE